MCKTIKTCLFITFALNIMVSVAAKEEFSGEIEGYTRIIGHAKEGYEEARRDALNLLILHLGVTELFIRSSNDTIRKIDDIENSDGNFTTISTKGEASRFSEIKSNALLPPLSKIINHKDQEFYFVTIYVQNSDIEKFKHIIDVLKAFPASEKRQEENIMDFYFRKVLEIKGNFTSRQTMTIANTLERQFFVSTVIRNDTIYVYPRDIYERRILTFLTQCFGRVQKNGNEIQISQPDFTMLERQSPLNLRLIKIDSDTPIPSLNYIMRQNGLDITGKQSSNERFACIISFTEQNKPYSTSIKVDVEIVDKLDEQLLLSTTLISPNFPKYSNIQAKAFMKSKVAEYIRVTLPWILAAY